MKIQEKFEPKIKTIAEEEIDPGEAEKEKMNVKDVFECEIDELRKKTEESMEIGMEEKTELLLLLSQWKREIKSFSEKDQERFEEIFEMIKDWNSEFFIEKVNEDTKIFDAESSENLCKHLIFSAMVELEKVDLSDKIQKLVEKIILSNGMINDVDQIEELNNLNINEEELKIVERMIALETNPEIDYGTISFIKNARKDTLSEDKKGVLQTLLDEKKFKEVKENIKNIERKFKEADMGVFIDWEYLGMVEKKESLEEVLNSVDSIKNICDSYNLSKVIDGDKIFNFLNFSDEKKEIILSEEFKEKIGGFKIKLDNLNELGDIYFLFYEIDEEKIFSKKEKEIKKILSSFKIEKISVNEFEKIFSYFSEEEIKELSSSEGNFANLNKEDCELLIKNSSYYKQISSELIENIRKTKGNYQARTFSTDLLKYISSSLAFSYMAFANPSKESLERLEEKGLESETHKKIYNKASSGVLKLEDMIPGRKTTKKMIERGNLEYLLAGQKLDISFDHYGILGKNIAEIKEEIDKRGEELLENYSENKEKYLPYLDSLLGYASEYKEEIKEILEIKDLWKFKFAHLKDLNSILDEIKDLEIEVERKKEKADINIYIQNLEEHLSLEKFSEIKEKISLIEVKNRNKALSLIDKMESVVTELKEGKNPEKKDIDMLLSNKAILKHLGLILSLESVKQMYQKMNQEEKSEEFLKIIEIAKEPEEYLGAMNMEPSCMRVGEEFEHGALTIAQSPILILEAKDDFGRIKGRSLLIPIKDKNEKWRFELKNTYGVGRGHFDDFTEKMEEILRKKKGEYYKETKKIITTDIIKGELPKSRKVLSTKTLRFYRDGEEMVELKEMEKE